MLRVLSKFISAVLSPYLTFIYLYAIIFLSAYYKIIPYYSLILLIGVVALFTTLIPFIISRINRISLNDKNSERGPLYLAFSIGNFALAYYLLSRGIPIWRISFLISATLAIITLFLFNRRYNISFHTTMYGVFIGVFFAIIKIQSPVSLDIIGFVILSGGILGSARVYLKEHTPGEVITGAILGFTWSYTGAIFTNLLF